MPQTSEDEIVRLTKEAFKKLSSYIYFDKQNLLIRRELALFVRDEKQKVLEKLAYEIQNYSSVVKGFVNRIDLTLLPKNVKENSNLIDSKYLSNRFYTNQIYKDNPLVDRINVFINAPFEVHLISTMWLLKYGKYFDDKLGSHCRGNRLEFTDNRLGKGRLLFKKYEGEYQKWWSDGISSAKKLFEKKKDVTILNFDFKSYYHSIELNLNDLETVISERDSGVVNDPLHKIFLDIHRKYYEKLLDSNIYDLKERKDSVSLPIGLLSSGVLANWYLLDFDELIENSIEIQYYGRYVDDLMIVIENSIIDKFNDDNVKNILDDSIKFGRNEDYLIHHFITKLFSKVFHLQKSENYDSPVYQVNSKQYENLTLQSSKFFIYQFNSDFSPQLLNKFIEEQQEKSSVFQFLSEDDDNIYKELDKITFETNFDNQEWGVNGLKHIEENKFKLSVYLSKLARGSVVSGSSYDVEEAEKVKKYFKGFYLLRNYFFWEKLLSIWLVRNDLETFYSAINDIKSQIDLLELKSNSKHSAAQTEALRKSLQEGLRNYLSVAINMCTSLSPTVVNQDARSILNDTEKEDSVLYRRTFLIRKNFVGYPLVQFTKLIESGSESVFQKEIIDQSIEANKDLLRIVSDFFPFRVKFYECCLFIFLCQLNRIREILPEEKRDHNFFDNEELLNTAFRLFCQINGVEKDEEEEVRDKYFKFLDMAANPVTGVSFPADIQIKPLKIGDGEKQTLRVCLANKYVDFRESVVSMTGAPNSDQKRFEEFNKIFDDAKKVKDSDVLVMPEIALPYHFLQQSMLFSVFNQTAVITGIEHWKIGTWIFNFVMTILPVRVLDDSDGVLLPRLKNHYAPEEERGIKSKGFVVPKPKPYQYDLISWRGVYFSVYYCFELADVKHRNLFLGLVDIIFAPVWNKDVHYYNSLVESASRDMHCFIVLANTTQYGDSRITRPCKLIRRDKLRVKGGTVKDHRATVMVSDLEIGTLRDFQAVNSNDTHDENAIFKPLPPDFPVNAAKLRKYRYLFEMSDVNPIFRMMVAFGL